MVAIAEHTSMGQVTVKPLTETSPAAWKKWRPIFEAAVRANKWDHSRARLQLYRAIRGPAHWMIMGIEHDALGPKVRPVKEMLDQMENRFVPLLADPSAKAWMERQETEVIPLSFPEAEAVTMMEQLRIFSSDHEKRETKKTTRPQETTRDQSRARQPPTPRPYWPSATAPPALITAKKPGSSPKATLRLVVCTV